MFRKNENVLSDNFEYLILTNFRAYLISRNQQIRISRGFISAISEKKGLKGFKILQKYCLYFRVFCFIAKTAKIILAKISENKVIIISSTISPGGTIKIKL